MQLAPLIVLRPPPHLQKPPSPPQSAAPPPMIEEPDTDPRSEHSSFGLPLSQSTSKELH